MTEVTKDQMMRNELKMRLSVLGSVTECKTN